MIEQILSTVRELIRSELTAALPRFRWATVTQLSPLRVRFDDQSAALGLTPDTLVHGLSVSDRVMTLYWLNRITIIGRRGGSPAGPEEYPSTSEVLTGDYSLIANWRALTTGWYYNQNGSMTGMPTTWGMVYVRRRGSEGHVTYYAQASGPQFRMVWNGATTSVVWEREYFNRELDTTGTVNLNDYTSPGIYNFNQDVTATNGTNFPINAAGVCEVMGVGTMRYQRYTAYKNHPGHVYYRNQYANVWGVWERIGGGVIGGMVTIALPTQGTVGQASVSFPTNRFTARPNLGLAAWTTAPQNVGFSISTLSATSVLIHAVRTTGTGDLNITWTANG